MRKKSVNIRKVRLYAILIAVLLVIEILSASFIRSAFLANMKESQTAAVSSYAHTFMYGEEESLAAYETVLRAVAHNIDIYVSDSRSEADFLHMVNTCIYAVSSMFADNVVSPYIIRNGTACYSDNRVMNIEEAGYIDAKYYTQMLNAESVIFTDVYYSEEQNQNIVTAALKCQNSDIIVAMNIHVKQFIINSSSLPISDKSAFYICDSKGTLISMQGTAEASEAEQEQLFLNNVVDKIKSGSLDKNSCVTNYNGRHIGIYYTVMSNGWYSIAAVPHDWIIENQHVLSVFFLICVMAVVFIAYRDLKLSQKIARANDTMNVLGNLYYAIYRINFKNDTYEIIKGSDYVSSKLEVKGSYDDFMRVALEVISDKAKQEFEASFSCDNIRMLVENNIKNFGGDFQRIFNDMEHWVNVRILYDENILTDEVILVFRDNEKEKQRALNENKLLQESLEAAKISEKTKQNFFKNMSHDMRTPLNAIIGLSKLAGEKTGDPEKLSEYIDNIHRSGVTLLNLVNEILNISKIQDGRILLNYSPIDIRQCISECVSAFTAQAYAEGKIFRTEYNIKDSRVLGDCLRISQIINNLLSNAMKFTNLGDKIELAVSQVECDGFSQYVITVTDTGIGMSEDFLMHIFEPYARETMFSENQIVGTGLGLPITHNIVVQMGGQIAVKSKPKNGTVFTVTLPFTVVNEAEASAPEPEVASGYTLDGKNILLVEDNILNMEVAYEILKMNGAEVVQAWNGKEAVECYEAAAPYSFDAILMDMNMPVLNGCDAARKIRESKREDSSDIPIIAVTANAFPEDISATMSAGMDAHISKPIDAVSLCQILEKLLSNRERV